MPFHLRARVYIRTFPNPNQNIAAIHATKIPRRNSAARRGVPSRGEHCQAAERAAADIEGHPAAAEFSQPE
jgi:hypothetical protein